MSESRLPYIENKVDKIASDVSDMKAVQAAQHEILKEHMRRTEANEKIVDRLTKLTYITLAMLALGGAHSLGIIEKLIGLIS